MNERLHVIGCKPISAGAEGVGLFRSLKMT